jgi:hypothetical protein
MKKSILILGDILAILITTFIGFASHGEAGLSFLPRIAATLFPLLISWFVLSPSLGLFQREVTINSKQLWRPVLGMVFAASLATILRGLILNAPVIPIFAVVLSVTSAIGTLVWRSIFYFVNRSS